MDGSWQSVVTSIRSYQRCFNLLWRISINQTKYHYQNTLLAHLHNTKHLQLQFAVKVIVSVNLWSTCRLINTSSSVCNTNWPRWQLIWTKDWQQRTVNYGRRICSVAADTHKISKRGNNNWSEWSRARLMVPNFITTFGYGSMYLIELSSKKSLLQSTSISKGAMINSKGWKQTSLPAPLKLICPMCIGITRNI